MSATTARRTFAWRAARLVNLQLNARMPATHTRQLSTDAARDGSDYFDDAPAPEDSDFESWFTRTAERLKHGDGPVFLGKSRPFPLNPVFKPVPPVPDAFKEQLYALWASDPQKWVPRALSNHFKVSIERVKAIIKLKTLQRRTERAGGTVHSEYAAVMERNLGAQPPRIAEASRQLLEDAAERTRPLLVAVPSHLDLSPEQAAALLDKKLRPIVTQLDAERDANTPYDPDPPRDENPEELKKTLFISHDADASTRWKFVFVDNNRKISQPLREVRIREPDGTLRLAMPVERALEQRIAARDFMPYKIMKHLGILKRATAQ